MTGEAAGLAGARNARATVRRRRDVPRSTCRPVSGDAYRDVTFQVRAGEIVGLAGAARQRPDRVAETVVGLRAADSGAVEIAGRRPRPGSVPDALAAGVGFVPAGPAPPGLRAR